jgi:transcriptional regulator with XRE-family HTH domain
MSGTTFEPTEASLARGQLIRKARTEKGLSQEELAARVGVSRVSITYYENGQTEEIAFQYATRLRDELELPLHFLLSETQRQLAESMRHPSDGVRDQDLWLYDAAGPRLSDDARNVALLWDALMDSDVAKAESKAMIEEAHRRANPVLYEVIKRREEDKEKQRKVRKKSPKDAA